MTTQPKTIDELLASDADLAVLLEKLTQSGRFKVLSKIDFNTLFNPDALTEDTGYAVILDTEATGKDVTKDRLIELGMVRFAYCRKTGEFQSIVAMFDELEDPGMPIAPAATRVNGITDEDVKGKRINDADVAEFVKDADFIVAHNAAFDRSLCEKRFPVFESKAWLCSQHQLDWLSAGVTGQKLEFIASSLGYFYEAHRADQDCLATLMVLSLKRFDGSQATPAFEGLKSGLELLVEQRNKVTYRLWAVHSAFEAKNLLRERGYYWSDGSKPGTEKAWWTMVSAEKLAEEMVWLYENAYKKGQFSVPLDEQTAMNRFSDRRGAVTRAHIADYLPS